MRALLLAVACLVSIGLGVLLTPVPVAGAVFAFGAPALALLGVILGGLDLSRARREGKPRDTALLGTVLAALGFFPALLTALTCGVCNALVSAGPIHVQRDVRFGVGPAPSVDGGVLPGLVPKAPRKLPDTSTPSPSPADDAPSTAGHAAPVGERAAPPRDAPSAPSRLPPPPLPAGPSPRP